ncbi:hypothetical protein Salat_2958600 [Sesamum alatum]|uniref:Uncharacterized protein n=1 Tax=Sesamum alatum TaxID=300844 RepID=A0AAE1XKK7_9LAMI|nr:hypothetical protein Salat_2958600 [Sesamum alatum]
MLDLALRNWATRHPGPQTTLGAQHTGLPLLNLGRLLLPFPLGRPVTINVGPLAAATGPCPPLGLLNYISQPPQENSQPPAPSRRARPAVTGRLPENSTRGLLSTPSHLSAVDSPPCQRTAIVDHRHLNRLVLAKRMSPLPSIFINSMARFDHFGVFLVARPSNAFSCADSRPFNDDNLPCVHNDQMNKPDRLDSGNGAPPAAAMFSLNSTEFPTLTESVRANSAKFQSKQTPSFSEVAASHTALQSQPALHTDSGKFFLANFASASIGTISNPLLTEFDLNIHGETIAQRIEVMLLSPLLVDATADLRLERTGRKNKVEIKEDQQVHDKLSMGSEPLVMEEGECSKDAEAHNRYGPVPRPVSVSMPEIVETHEFNIQTVKDNVNSNMNASEVTNKGDIANQENHVHNDHVGEMRNDSEKSVNDETSSVVGGNNTAIMRLMILSVI